MALILDANGNLVDDGLGPQGRPGPVSRQGVMPPALPGPRGLGNPYPLGYTTAPGAGGPRGGGGVYTPTTPAPAAVLPVAAPAPAGTPALTPVIPDPIGPANAAVLAADRANLAAITPPEPGPVGAVPMPAASGPTAQPAERGVYNMYNTSTASLPQPTSAGLSFFGNGNGSGGETATQYLQRMGIQDRENAITNNQQGLSNEVMRLQSTITDQSSIGDIAATRQRLQALTPLLAGQNQAQSQITQSRIQADSAANTSQNQLQAAGLTAQIGADARLQSANLTGQYGVEAARLRAQGLVNKAQVAADSPQGQLALQRQQILGTRLARLNAKIAAGTATDQDYLDFTAASSPQPQQFTNPITGAPLSPQEIALLQQQNLGTINPAR